MIETSLRERVELCAARSLGLAENLNDAIVLVDSLRRVGLISVEIPEQSLLMEIDGDQFVNMLEKALIQFDDNGSWLEMSREVVMEYGGALDDIRDTATIYYRIVNPDGSIPLPPTISNKDDRIVLFH